MKSDLTTIVAITSMATVLIIGTGYALVGLLPQAAAQLAADTNATTTTIDGTNQTTNTTDLVVTPPLENLTSSIEIFPTVMQALRSQMNVSLSDAITIAMDAVGQNASAIAASIQPEREFLVYRVFVTDADSNIHMVVVDPGDGNVLLSQQMPPWIGSTILGIPSSGLPGSLLPGGIP